MIDCQFYAYAIDHHWSEDRVDEKLTVTKCSWLCISATDIKIYISSVIDIEHVSFKNRANYMTILFMSVCMCVCKCVWVCVYVCARTFVLTFSLFSFRLTITAVICWSMKIRMTASRAGIIDAGITHHGFFSLSGLMNHSRLGRVGLNAINK